MTWSHFSCQVMAIDNLFLKGVINLCHLMVLEFIDALFSDLSSHIALYCHRLHNFITGTIMSLMTLFMNVLLALFLFFTAFQFLLCILSSSVYIFVIFLIGECRCISTRGMPQNWANESKKF